MKDVVILDAGPMVSGVDRLAPAHAACAAVLTDRRFEFIVPAMCLAEAVYLIERDMGQLVEAQFLEGFGFQIMAPEPQDFPRMAQLVRRYADFPLGGTDASIVALDERLDIRTIITLDGRHFAAIGPTHCEQFRILP